jgi:uncharacterized protein YjbJ (UPF0337 family)
MSEEFKGRMKEAYGAITGDEEKKAEGQALQRKAKAQKEAEQREKKLVGTLKKLHKPCPGRDLGRLSQPREPRVQIEASEPRRRRSKRSCPTGEARTTRMREPWTGLRVK